MGFSCFSLIPSRNDERRPEGSSATRSILFHVSTIPSMPTKSSSDTSRQLSCRSVREERSLIFSISGRIPSSSNTGDSDERSLFLIASSIPESAARLPCTILSRSANAFLAPRNTL
ncbi:hypothetical protein PMAYCL1PPCAC_02095, partial [Pristionchus mayeri]